MLLNNRKQQSTVDKTGIPFCFSSIYNWRATSTYSWGHHKFWAKQRCPQRNACKPLWTCSCTNSFMVGWWHLCHVDPCGNIDTECKNWPLWSLVLQSFWSQSLFINGLRKPMSVRINHVFCDFILTCLLVLQYIPWTAVRLYFQHSTLKNFSERIFAWNVQIVGDPCSSIIGSIYSSSVTGLFFWLDSTCISSLVI